MNDSQPRPDLNGQGANIAKPPDRHQLAIAILAIATAAVGFGLFGFNLKIDPVSLALTGIPGATSILFSFVVLTLLVYAILVISISRLLLRDENPTGRDLVGGPFYWMSIEMLLLGVTYIMRIFQTPLPI